MQGKTDLIMDNLIAEGKAKPMLVVMLDGNLVQPNFRENFLKLFQDDLIQCVIPFVEKNYKVKTDSKNRALAGLSMGGIQTLYVGIYHSELFSYLGVFSSGWFQPQNELAQSQYNFLKDNVAAFKDNVKEFWFSMGGQRDIAYQNCKKCWKSLMICRFHTPIATTAAAIPGRPGGRVCGISHPCFSSNPIHGSQASAAYFGGDAFNAASSFLACIAGRFIPILQSVYVH